MEIFKGDDVEDVKKALFSSTAGGVYTATASQRQYDNAYSNDKGANLTQATSGNVS